ncbi:MAG: phosphoenolpyruvate--protein phosphotransferase [Candidatus Riflebacteria bacterium]|nr:phosphoenolpyruvate--protein phosphotransferase [Candidatus Riflebacteria bacterium]
MIAASSTPAHGGSPSPLRLHGIVGSRVVCAARAYVYRRRLEVACTPIESAGVEAEISRLDVAMDLTRRDIEAAQAEALKKHGAKYAAIFDSHLLVLSDPQFRPELVRRLKKELVNVESILHSTIDVFMKRFLAIEDEYLRERAIDMKDVGDRILRHLLGLEGPATEIGNEPYVLIAEDVTPTEMLDFSRSRLQGICLDSGGATSHTAILAGALGIPAVFGLTNLSQAAHTGDEILVDSRREGVVILHPDAESRATVPAFSSLSSVSMSDTPALEYHAQLDQSRDGIVIALGANIARTEELPSLERLGVKRIGLFRSEFLFMESVDLPGENFQEDIYRKVVAAAPLGAVLRTIDIGSDKPVKYLPFPREANPSMGFRSVRFALSRPDVLLPQLRAMIRAASTGKARIIFPMVSTPNELQAIERIWQQALDQVAPAVAPEWGIMVEVPSALFMLDGIARYTRYISLGTNDLLQFFYAMDRSNERLSTLATPLCIPFLRMLLYGVSVAKGEGVKVGICGEMAADPAGFAILLGIGVDEFSMRPAALDNIRSMLPRLSVREIIRATNEILTGEVDANLRKLLSERFPELSSDFLQGA